MSRTRRVLHGAGLGYAYQAVVVVVGLWLTPVLLTTLGQHDYGLWLVALQSLAYLALLDLGVVALLPREVARITGQAGTAEVGAAEVATYVGETARLVMLQWPVVAAVSLLVWFSIPDAWQALRGPAALLLLTYTVAFPGRILSGVLQGLQDLTFLGSANIISWAAGTVVTIGLVLGTSLGLYGISAGWAVTQLLLVGAWTWRITTRHPHAWPKSLPALAEVPLAARLPQALWVSVSQLAQVFVQATDLIVLARVVGPAAVVPYSITKKLLDVVANQPQMIMQAAIPGLAQVRGSGDRADLRRITATLRQMMLMLSGLVASVVVMVNEPFVAWWVSPDLYGGSLLVAGLVSVMLLRQLNTTSVYTLFCFGRERRLSLTTLCDGTVTVGASLVLAVELGAMGVVCGALLGVCLVSLPANIRAELQETGDSFGGFVATLRPLLWRLALVLAIVCAIRSVWLPVGFLAMASSALVATCVYGLIMMPLLRRPPIATYVPEWLRPLLRMNGSFAGNSKDLRAGK